MPTRSKAIILVVVGILIALLAWGLGFERNWERLILGLRPFRFASIPNSPYPIPIFFLGLASVVAGSVLLAIERKLLSSQAQTTAIAVIGFILFLGGILVPSVLGESGPGYVSPYSVQGYSIAVLGIALTTVAIGLERAAGRI